MPPESDDEEPRNIYILQLVYMTNDEIVLCKADREGLHYMILY